ncbi:hypothetical protein ACQXZZ_04040 [Corynebacterium diphtheriae]|uniref:hypothetical protein n=1 Tax=Corynebacterium diphtheriae TaxID=1717 RepID=UPI0005C6D06E|nr:hypothetical protein [Corynebacterium diphtheriae]AWR14863.1 hypothetical protein B11Q_00145 [Corynebacterium diphtheriae]MBG9313404.1 hypothetical protein [Corynebacterium diphtheriae bv. mitis]MBN4654221.1 hypothetical protein [Corynebacterium diphtheriae bv. mitis]ODS19393.1 hypothetical protein BGK43_10825 [Corynebacterium diphtheriae]ODS21046.1 hypothetical protein BGK40_09295 [Corynebacterium diphtheriae]
MRHSPEQFYDTMNYLAEPIQFALTQGLKNARRANLRAFQANKKSFLSHIIRSGAYDYLEDNPVAGFILVKKAHPLNQAVCLQEEATGLEIRLAKLKKLSLTQSTIPFLDSDPVIQQQLTLYECGINSPGLAFISWDQPSSKNSYEFNLRAIRQSLRRNSQRGQADLVFSLNPRQSEMIPKVSFDPNAIYDYELENENDEDFS